MEGHDVPTKTMTEHIVVGEEFDAFTEIAREITSQVLHDLFCGKVGASRR